MTKEVDADWMGPPPVSKRRVVIGRLFWHQWTGEVGIVAFQLAVFFSSKQKKKNKDEQRKKKIYNLNKKKITTKRVCKENLAFYHYRYHHYHYHYYYNFCCLTYKFNY